MQQKQITGSPEDIWEEQREGRRVDIKEIPDLDGCFDSFMSVYLYQNKSNDIIFNLFY